MYLVPVLFLCILHNNNSELCHVETINIGRLADSVPSSAEAVPLSSSSQTNEFLQDIPDRTHGSVTYSELFRSGKKKKTLNNDNDEC